eukprot:14621917-Heterocapsa_arctica.AAC.1
MQPAIGDDSSDNEDDDAASSNGHRNRDFTIPRQLTEIAVNDAWSDDHAVYPPRWEEAPGANPDEPD